MGSIVQGEAMNRKQLEECAWTKTPKDERRSQKKFSDWKTKRSVTQKLRGNNREVLVFDPSGGTPGTMNPWVPLWSLYTDELLQRCRDEQQPRLRAPYRRSRPDYTGDVESSGTPSSRQHHATRKKSPGQIAREIDEVLSRGPRRSLPPSHATRKARAPRVIAYRLKLTPDELGAVEFARGRYAWPDMLSMHAAEDGSVAFTESEMWQWVDDVDSDAEGGHAPFPLASDAFAAKLQHFRDSVV